MKALTTLRCKILKIEKYNVELSSILEKNSFTLQIFPSEYETLKDINQNTELDINMIIERDNTGKIIYGNIQEFFIVENINPENV